MSLWDIVNRFKVAEFSRVIQQLTSLEHTAMISVGLGGGAKVSPEMTERLLETAEMCKAVCNSNGFSESFTKAFILTERLKDSPQSNVSHIETEARNLRDSIVTDAHRRAFIRVDQSFTQYVDNDTLLGKSVRDSFPSAVYDIGQAGNCIAIGCPTAAVFHLMRVVEWGMRFLCIDLGLRKVRRKDKKSGRVTYTPLGWTDWETLINQMRSRATGRISKLKRGGEKQSLQEFYIPMIQDVDAMKDAFRNHVMHTRREYTSSEAQAILDRVRHLMTNLASRVSE